MISLLLVNDCLTKKQVLLTMMFDFVTSIQGPYCLKMNATCVKFRCEVPYMGNIWRGKFWRTMQVKAIGKEKFGK